MVSPFFPYFKRGANIVKYLIKIIFLQNLLYEELCIIFEQQNKKAQVAELADALVSNTNGAIRAGSSPALGTKKLSDLGELFLLCLHYEKKDIIIGFRRTR